MKSKTIAVDLAKNVFEIGISARPGQMTKTYRLSRGKFLSFFANQELATVRDGSLQWPPITGDERSRNWGTQWY